MRKSRLAPFGFLLVIASVFTFLLSSNIYAHPGRTAADGCHYCRTNCEKWGLVEGERHCHNQPNPSHKNLVASIPTDHKDQGLKLVIRVVDGDTIDIEGGERIRLIGVDTPETVDPRKPVQYFGKEASAFTRKMVLGKKVRLDSYEKNKGGFGRSRALVYLEDGTFVNAEIIKQGYGFCETRFPFKYLEDFRKFEKEARYKKLGLWADEK